MTTQETIRLLKMEMLGDSEQMECAKQIAVEALEKQIPKKPIPHIVKVERLKIGNARWGKGTTVYKCPCCNNFISRLYDYCFKCGQAIDWSDEI